MRATIFHTLQRSSHKYNAGTGSKNTGDINPGDHGAGFIYTPVHSLGARVILIEDHTNGEELDYKRYGSYSLYLALIPLLINPILILWIFRLLNLKYDEVFIIFWMIILMLVALLIISFILGILTRNTKEGKSGLYSSLIIGIAYAIFIVTLLNPPFY